MPLKKILIVPSARFSPTYASPFWKKTLRKLLNNHNKNSPIVHDGELQYWGDIPKILGSENVFMLSEKLDERLTYEPEPGCPYPSCHGVLQPTHITVADLPKIISQVDAVILSVAAKHLVEPTLISARQADTPVAILDWPDHAELYGDPDARTHTYRQFTYKKDFVLYFKQDLLPHIADSYTLPISPLPIRPEYFDIKAQNKKYSIFFSGRPRYEISQGDKQQLIELVKKQIPNEHIVLHTDRASFMTRDQYNHALASSRISLSPSCRVWDSFRHCEAAMAPATALLAPNPYIKTAGPKLQDMKNAILYQTILKKDKYYLNDDNIISRIQDLLNEPNLLTTIADNWRKVVLTDHTVNARSQYIINSIAQVI